MVLRKIKSTQDSISAKAKSFSGSNDNLTLKAENFSMPLWGGHYGRGLNALIDQATSSLEYDKKHFKVVINSLKSQLKMRKKRKIISEIASVTLSSALDSISKEISEGRLALDTHSTIYEIIDARLREICPKDAEDLYIAHSVASQLAGDLRLITREFYDTLESSLQNLQTSLTDKAEENVKSIFPGTTHGQLSLPTSLGHHLLAHVEIFGRDRVRMKEARRRMNESAYNSGEVAGSLFNISREMVAKSLDFDRSVSNTVDANNSRDFVLEFISVGSIVASNITRLCSDILSWHSTENNYISFSNEFVEQSQVTPYRRDPLATESVRGRASQITGYLTGSFAIVNSLPLNFTNDLLQLGDLVNKTFEELHLCIRALAAIVADMKINRKIMKAAASHSYSTATDLVDWLIINSNLNKVDAESRARQIIEYAINKGKKLSLLELDEIQKFVLSASEDIYSVLIPSRALISRRSGGGSNPVQIRKAIRNIKRKYL